MACDSLGNPLSFIVTGGNIADCTIAEELVLNLEFESLMADKGYDTNKIVEGFSTIIPPKRNRKIQRFYDKHYYKEHHKIENMFGFMKHYRRILSRFDKLKKNFLSFLYFVGTLQWLK